MAKRVTRWKRPFEDFLTHLRIDSKEIAAVDEHGSPLDMWDSQKIFLDSVCDGLEDDQRIFACLKARQLGVCLDPATRVLTADLQWIPIVDLNEGDEIIAVDESPAGGTGNHRHMRTGVVEASIKVERTAYRISFDDGRSVICTGTHPWLAQGLSCTNYEWSSIDGKGREKLKIGSAIRWVTKPWEPASVEDGWFGGMLDGEGSMALKTRSGTSVNVSQREGPVWDRMIKYCEDRGYNYRVESDKAERPSKFGKVSVPKIVFSRTNEVFKLIGQTRPTRFLGKRFWEDKELPGKHVGGVGRAKIVDIEYLGPRTMVDLQTSTGTYIAEGFVSHNTTISLAIDIFWLLVHPGLMGALVSDTEANRNVFRATIERYVKNLPADLVGPRFKIPRVNRDFILFPNGSRLDFIVAGTRSKSNWGESRGYTLQHMTEIANYGDPNGIASFRETFSQTHPDRLCIMESTAKGFNHWKDIWDECERDPYSKRQIFIGWWAKDLNRIERKDRKFQLYGMDQPNGIEAELIRAVRERYNYNIDAEQLAWIRWRTSDQSADVSNIAQNLPWVPEQAFVFSGFSFFQTRLIAKDIAEMDEHDDDYSFKAYRYWIGTDFFATKMEQLGQGSSPDEWELRIWEEPVKNAQYAIGVDPAFGRNDWKDKHGISIWRCFADRLVQVAEYASCNIEAHQAAWVLAHLAGSYRNCIVNLELSGGPGRAVMREFDRLRNSLRQEMYSNQLKEFDWEDVLNEMRWYLYHRPDAMGAGYAYNFMTTRDSKFDLMNGMRSNYTTRMLAIRSRPLLSEMQAVVQEGSTIEAPGREKDDRVVACALASYAWDQWIRPSMIAQNMTYDRVMSEERGETGMINRHIDRLVVNYFKRAEEIANMDPRELAPKLLQDRGLV